jgi:cytochrome c peroxidase
MIRPRATFLLGLGCILAVIGLGFWTAYSAANTTSKLLNWTPQERQAIRALALSSLPALPPDPSNKVANDPRAAALGKRLFFDPRLSANNGVSCSSCHDPQRGFTDGRALSQGLGQTDRNSMALIGAAYSPWLFWDGRSDSQWAQALKPLESAVEHGSNRLRLVKVIARRYPLEYRTIFGALPNLSNLPEDAGPVPNAAQRTAWNKLGTAKRTAITRAFVNIGKSIAAYERTLLPTTTRFDRFANTLTADTRPEGKTGNAKLLSPEEAQGLRLFIGQAGCTSCHSGPLLTNDGFHNTGVPALSDLPRDRGRASGVQIAVTDEANCLSPFSDAKPDQCDQLTYAKRRGKELEGAFRVPSLRNVALTGPYMDAGQHRTLAEVLQHYQHAPKASVGTSELKPLNATARQLEQLEAFLKTLTEVERRAAPAKR